MTTIQLLTHAQAPVQRLFLAYLARLRREAQVWAADYRTQNGGSPPAPALVAEALGLPEDGAAWLLRPDGADGQVIARGEPGAGGKSR